MRSGALGSWIADAICFLDLLYHNLQPRLPLKVFIRKHLTRKYGIKLLAEKQLQQFSKAVNYFSQDSARYDIVTIHSLQ